MYVYMYAGRDILASAWNEGQPLAGPKKKFWASKKLEVDYSATYWARAE